MFIELSVSGRASRRSSPQRGLLLVNTVVTHLFCGHLCSSRQTCIGEGKVECAVYG